MGLDLSDSLRAPPRWMDSIPPKKKYSTSILPPNPQPPSKSIIPPPPPNPNNLSDFFVPGGLLGLVCRTGGDGARFDGGH